MISAPSAVLVYRWTDHTINPTGEARSVLRGVLKDLGLSDEVISDGVLAVSELVANAHEHACGPYEAHLRSVAGRHICGIHDGRPLPPADLYLAAVASPEATTSEAVSGLPTGRGRGLHIVNELTQGQWGFQVTDCGTKAAWVFLAEASAARKPEVARRPAGDSSEAPANARRPLRSTPITTTENKHVEGPRCKQRGPSTSCPVRHWRRIRDSNS
ncbi:ATP-binding protein [Streptomyces sp. NPDC048737]|uniref:ATP-binding protein n=1 Tax=unclassified Streptomyces TaxID=2593676 RepID=UPI003415A3B2